MPIRAIVIMLVLAVVLAVCYRDQIYKWVRENLGKDQQKKEQSDAESEEECEKRKQKAAAVRGSVLHGVYRTAMKKLGQPTHKEDKT